MVEHSYYLLIGAVLFVLGLVGFVTRRNLSMIFREVFAANMRRS